MHYKEHGPRQLEVEITAKSSRSSSCYFAWYLWATNQHVCIQSRWKIGFEVFVNDILAIVTVMVVMVPKYKVSTCTETNISVPLLFLHTRKYAGCWYYVLQYFFCGTVIMVSSVLCRMFYMTFETLKRIKHHDSGQWTMDISFGSSNNYVRTKKYCKAKEKYFQCLPVTFLLLKTRCSSKIFLLFFYTMNPGGYYVDKAVYFWCHPVPMKNAS